MLTAHLGAVLENIFPPLIAVLTQQYLHDQALEQLGGKTWGKTAFSCTSPPSSPPIVKHFEILPPSEEHESKQESRGWSLTNLKGELLSRGRL